MTESQVDLGHDIPVVPRSSGPGRFQINDLLRVATERQASDLHITVEAPPTMRLNESMIPIVDSRLNGDDTEALLYQMFQDEDLATKFERFGEIDLAYSVPGLGRYRVNGFRQRGSVGVVIRIIPARIKTITELGLPDVVEALARRPNGIILVTGPTGSGKTTTLAAMIDLVNSDYQYHIVTLEDPIEFLHRHKRSIVNQREIGKDTRTFATGLRAALRENPDVILVGELRDLDTISIAITAAETGHLVMATLHTTDAALTVDRIIDVFPPYQQSQIRVQLAGTLQGVISQQLIMRSDGQGRVAAFEALVATPAVRNLIREGKTHQIPTQIQMGGRFGMQTLEGYMRDLMMNGVITDEEYRRKISHLAETGAYVTPPGGSAFDNPGQGQGQGPHGQGQGQGPHGQGSPGGYGPRPGNPGVRGNPYQQGSRFDRGGRPGNNR